MKRIYRTAFDAAHYIKDHKKCGERHGHTYHLEVTLDIDQQWFDFHLIKCNVDEVLKEYDHHDMGNMTCEQLAKQIYAGLALQFSSQKIKSIKVRLFETEHFGVEVP